MAGIKNAAERNDKISSLDIDGAKKQIARWAKEWDMSEREATEYALVLGVKRRMTLEAHAAKAAKPAPKPRAKGKAKAPKSGTRKAAAKAA